MKAVVVYESLWGNTAAVAKAIAEGIADGASALPTSEATPEALAGADLIVVGAPVLGFSLPTDAMRAGLPKSEAKAPTPPDLSHPSVRSWMATLPAGSGRFAAFETRIWWSPGSATKAIGREMQAAGFRGIGEPGRFIVTGRYGPLKDGELDRARKWGAALAASIA